LGGAEAGIKLLLIDPLLPRVLVSTMLVSERGEVIVQGLTLAIVILQLLSLKEVSVSADSRYPMSLQKVEKLCHAEACLNG
jgi:hypothetical protein